MIAFHRSSRQWLSTRSTSLGQLCTMNSLRSGARQWLSTRSMQFENIPGRRRLATMPPSKVNQTTFGRKGDALQACFASLLDVPMADVPDFLAEPDYVAAIQAYLRPRDLAFVRLDFDGGAAPFAVDGVPCVVWERPRSRAASASAASASRASTKPTG